MLGLGFSTATTEQVGEYGEGFKSASMKLGQDALVLSQRKFNNGYGRCVGLLSKSMHEREELERGNSRLSS